MEEQVFISWSGELSKKIAKDLSEWLSNVIQLIKPYYSPDSIEKGELWNESISKTLSNTNYGIICLTSDNFNAPWILFEAGALAKNSGISRVMPILFNVEKSEIKGPLTSFQLTDYNRDELFKLVKDLNNGLSDNKLSEPQLRGAFELWWPKLDEKILMHLNDNPIEINEPKRTDREILEETLELTRENNRRTRRIELELINSTENEKEFEDNSNNWTIKTSTTPVFFDREQIKKIWNNFDLERSYNKKPSEDIFGSNQDEFYTEDVIIKKNNKSEE